MFILETGHYEYDYEYDYKWTTNGVSYQEMLKVTLAQNYGM